MVGDEVTTEHPDLGHFNVFPLDHWDSHPYRHAKDANRLFSYLREKGNAAQIPLVIQLNHPRWGNIDYFGRTGLDPVAGVSADANFSLDFNTIEVLNENSLWGYWDSDLPRAGWPTGSSRHSVLNDWFGLLNRGHRFAATGNSDSHAVEAIFAGIPRNYVVSETDDPSATNDAAIAQAFRKGQCFTTSGPFPIVTINGQGPGSEVARNPEGLFAVSMTIRCASWIDCDRVRVMYNGTEIRSLEVPDSREVKRAQLDFQLDIPRDGWVVFLIEGDESLAPIIRDTKRPTLPIAIVNPIWIDADGDGAVRAPIDQLEAWLDAAGSGAIPTDLGPSESRLLVIEAARRGNAAADGLVRESLLGDRDARLAGFLGAEYLRRPALLDAVDAAATEGLDALSRVRAFRAAVACGADDAVGRAVALYHQIGAAAVQEYAEDILEGLQGHDLRSFRVITGLSATKNEALWTVDYGPEHDLTLSLQPEGAGTWTIQSTDETGYLDLLRRDSAGKSASDGTISYAGFFVDTEVPRDVPFLIGSDDGCRLYLGETLIYEDRGQHGAYLSQHLGMLTLQAGRTRVLVKIRNGGGAHGLRMRLLGEDLSVSTQP